jgi:rhamnosyltransferase
MRVYLIGSKGIPAAYGGFETFADRLVSGNTKNIEYVVTGMSDKDESYLYNDARCVQFKTNNSVVGRMSHMLRALSFVLKDSKSSPESVVYVLGCRAGIFLPFFRSFLKKKNVKIFVNPDGAEWKRAKWNLFAKGVVLVFEWLLVKSADLVICDSMAIKDIMKKEFSIPEKKLAFAAYGSEIYEPPKSLPIKLKLDHEAWAKKHGIFDEPYFLMVGRFVPENNFELIIREFMASHIKANLVIISNISDGNLKNLLYSELKVDEDPRIKLVGTLYDNDLLKIVRSKAIAHIHGHEVGGTNPSLLEALGSTQVSLVYDVSFNREVAVDAAYYFDRQEGSLAKKAEEVLSLDAIERINLEKKAKQRIKDAYSWPIIIEQYEGIFLNARPTL